MPSSTHYGIVLDSFDDGKYVSPIRNAAVYSVLTDTDITDNILAARSQDMAVSAAKFMKMQATASEFSTVFTLGYTRYVDAFMELQPFYTSTATCSPLVPIKEDREYLIKGQNGELPPTVSNTLQRIAARNPSYTSSTQKAELVLSSTKKALKLLGVNISNTVDSLKNSADADKLEDVGAVCGVSVGSASGVGLRYIVQILERCTSSGTGPSTWTKFLSFQTASGTYEYLFGIDIKNISGSFLESDVGKCSVVAHPFLNPSADTVGIRKITGTETAIVYGLWLSQYRIVSATGSVIGSYQYDVPDAREIFFPLDTNFLSTFSKKEVRELTVSSRSMLYFWYVRQHTSGWRIAAYLGMSVVSAYLMAITIATGIGTTVEDGVLDGFISLGKALVKSYIVGEVIAAGIKYLAKKFGIDVVGVALAIGAVAIGISSGSKAFIQSSFLLSDGFSREVAREQADIDMYSASHDRLREMEQAELDRRIEEILNTVEVSPHMLSWIISPTGMGNSEQISDFIARSSSLYKEAVRLPHGTPALLSTLLLLPE